MNFPSVVRLCGRILRSVQNTLCKREFTRQARRVFPSKIGHEACLLYAVGGFRCSIVWRGYFDMCEFAAAGALLNDAA